MMQVVWTEMFVASTGLDIVDQINMSIKIARKRATFADCKLLCIYDVKKGFLLKF